MNSTATRYADLPHNVLGFTGELTLEEQHAATQEFLAEFVARRVELTYHDGAVIRGLLVLEHNSTLEAPTRGQCHPNDRVSAVVRLVHVEAPGVRRTHWVKLGRPFGIALITDIKVAGETADLKADAQAPTAAEVADFRRRAALARQAEADMLAERHAR